MKITWRDGIIGGVRISKKQLNEWWRAQKYLSPCPSVKMVRRWQQSFRTPGGQNKHPVLLPVQRALKIQGAAQKANEAEEQLLSQLRTALGNPEVQLLGRGGGYSAVAARINSMVLKVSVCSVIVGTPICAVVLWHSGVPWIDPSGMGATSRTPHRCWVSCLV